MFRDVRFSGADGALCTMNGCLEEDWCMCQVCRICEASRVPLGILQLKEGMCVHCHIQKWTNDRDSRASTPATI